MNTFLKMVALILTVQAISINSYARESAKPKQTEFVATTSDKRHHVSGIIEWPKGKLGDWNQGVVVMVSALGFIDRDGWSLPALNATWVNRSPLKMLGDEFVRAGYMVVRFENIGVLPPAKKCRSNTTLKKFDISIVLKNCIAIDAAKDQSVENHVQSIAAVLAHVRKKIPTANRKIVLMGFSEGLSHIVKLVSADPISPMAVVSIGSPAEDLKTVTQWQAIGRIMMLMNDLDTNHDDFISNDEIVSEIKQRKIEFMGDPQMLLNMEQGGWEKGQLANLQKKLETSFEEFKQTKYFADERQLNWMTLRNESVIPTVTNAFYKHHFFDTLDPKLVLKNRKVPSLWLWGGKDQQINIVTQSHLVSQKSELKLFSHVIYSDRHHLLSKNEDFDWFEPKFTNEVVSRITQFLDAQKEH